MASRVASTRPSVSQYGRSMSSPARDVRACEIPYPGPLVEDGLQLGRGLELRGVRLVDGPPQEPVALQAAREPGLREVRCSVRPPRARRCAAGPGGKAVEGSESHALKLRPPTARKRCTSWTRLRRCSARSARPPAQSRHDASAPSSPRRLQAAHVHTGARPSCAPRSAHRTHSNDAVPHATHEKNRASSTMAADR
jgi:hypothetical protein